MKGIAHFVSGVAAASFLPWSMAAAQAGCPWYFVLGGVFGILPDTLDFKFYRFFYRHDVYLDPDPRHPDPQAIADQLAAAICSAMRQPGMYRVKCGTVRLGADYWQQYVIKFDNEAQAVLVRMGPVVTTGQVPVPAADPPARPVARAALPCPVRQDYDATTRVDIFDGPTFGFERDGRGGVVLHFLPWHREWTHSLVVGLGLALLGGWVTGLATAEALYAAGWGAWLAGGARVALVILAAYSVHVLEDQLGYMGANLLYPFTRRRLPGLHWMRSGDAWPNFATVWISCVLLFWNLYQYGRAHGQIVYQFNFLAYVFYALLLPAGVAMLLLRLASRGAPPAPAEAVDDWDDAPA